jgi:hypothetical protein
MSDKRFDTDSIIKIFKSRRDIVLDKGLNDSEIGALELKYGFKFPVDLRHLLQNALPIGMMWFMFVYLFYIRGTLDKLVCILLCLIVDFQEKA